MSPTARDRPATHRLTRHRERATGHAQGSGARLSSLTANLSSVKAPSPVDNGRRSSEAAFTPPARAAHTAHPTRAHDARRLALDGRRPLTRRTGHGHTSRGGVLSSQFASPNTHARSNRLSVSPTTTAAAAASCNPSARARRAPRHGRDRTPRSRTPPPRRLRRSTTTRAAGLRATGRSGAPACGNLSGGRRSSKCSC